MSMTLGSITLPNPVSFEREFVESGSTNTALTGRTTKDIRNRKERFILKFERLTLTEINSVLSEYNLETTRNFTSSEANLTISSTPVHIEVDKRDYVKGGEFRSDLTLVLTEVT